jgi:hypothetical protein
MKTRLVLKPGKRGTRKLLAEWGRRLVCVRYQYDIRKRRRRKTVELILEEGRWEPRPEATVNVQVAYEEYELRKKIKAAGGRWDARTRTWRLKYGKALAIGLGERLTD